MQRRVLLNRGPRASLSSIPSPSVPTPLPHIYRYGGGGRAEPDSVSDLITAARSLDGDQRRRLLAALALDSQKPRSANDREAVMWADALYEAIIDAFGDSSGIGGPAVIQRMMTSSSARQPIEEFMHAIGAKQFNVREQQAAYRLVARLLVDRAREVARYSGVPFSIKLTLNCMSELRGIFDKAFPGYLRSGLAAMIVRRIVSGEAATAR